jgi:hypothetical protein
MAISDFSFKGRGRLSRALLSLLGRGDERETAKPPASVLCTLNGVRRLELAPLDMPPAAEIAANNHLARFAKAVTSQDGEDGVIAEIFSRLKVDRGWCVEFGAWDGKFHCNTWDLVHNHGWKAVYVEPHAQAFGQLLQNCAGMPDVHCFNEFVNVEGEGSLAAILARTPIPADFDLLVIDIDSNDYFVWRGFEKYRPKVVMIEFNPFIPADISFFKWNDGKVKASASLAAVYELARTKGYELISVIGGNAIFVRRELFGLFDVRDNHPTAMFRSHWETKMFQGYDGSLYLVGNRKLIWRHQLDRNGQLDHVEVADNDIQVLPEGLRVFRPRLSFCNDFLDRCAGQIDRGRVPSNRLLEFQHNVTSENGEDGILRRIFELVGATEKFCVEIGAYDGRTFSNTWSLINEQGWSALLVEKDDEAVEALGDRYRKNPKVTVVHAQATTRGDTALEHILHRGGSPRSFDFLCIDVEGNDYNLWAALKNFEPRTVMIDFNPTISNDVIFAQEDDATVNIGASLRAFIELARFKGYELAAATTWNAIFVRRDLFPALGLGDNAIEKMYYPILETRVFQSIDSYLSVTGCDRLIRHDYVFDPDFLQPLPSNVREMPFTTGNLGELRSTFYERPAVPKKLIDAAE